MEKYHRVLVDSINIFEEENSDSNEFVFFIDVSYKFIYANRSFLNHFKYTLANLKKTKLDDVFILNDSENEVLDIFEKSANKQVIKLTCNKGDNVFIDVSLRVNPIFNEDGIIVGYKCLVDLCGDSKRTMDSFWNSMLKLERDFKAMPEFLFKLDKMASILDFKYFDLELNSYEQNELVGQKIDSIFPQYIVKRIIKAFQKIQNLKNIEYFQFPFYFSNVQYHFEARVTRSEKHIFNLIIRDITKQKQNEEALKTSVSRFLAVWEHSLDGMRLLDHDGYILDVNNAFCELVEMSRDELIGKLFYEIYADGNPESYFDAHEKIRNSFNTKNFKSYYTGVLKLKSGASKFFDIVSTLVEPKSDLPLFNKEVLMLTIFRDVTQKIHTEENVLKLKKAVDASGEVIFMTDIEGVISFINPAFTSLYGYEKEDVIGKETPRILNSGKNGSKLYEKFWKKILEKKRFHGELINKSKDGEEIYVEETVDPVIDENGHIINFLAIQRDITARKISENAIKYSEKRFRSIWEKSYDGMRLTDAEGRIISVNNAFCKLFGKSEVELLNEPFSIVYQLEDSESNNHLLKYKKQFVDKSFSNQRYSHSILHNGKQLYLNVSYSFIDGLDGNTLLLGIYHDVTEYKIAEEKLKNTEELAALGKTSAYLSHEIKSPLASIKNYLDLISKETELPTSVLNPLSLMRGEVDHLNKLLKDVLHFSKHLSLIKIDIDLHLLAEKIMELLSPLLKQKKIHIFNLLPGIKVKGDYLNLQSVFMNLFENAIDAISFNGTIEIFSEVKTDGVHIYIKDDGAGIKSKERIFDPFYSTKTSGTGLGLAIVRKIMELHDGEIKLKSSQPGSTIFELLFKKQR